MLQEENAKEFEMKIPSQIFAESELEDNEHKFIVYFLYDDEDQSVRVEEVQEIDLSQVIQHLDLGGSVFITHRREPETYTNLYVEKELADSNPVI
ncbi:MAG: hypothetical protein ACETV1_01685 [Candidatus Bathyarchaeia archaeon]